MGAKGPNWDYWGKLRTVKLWEAVCLSLGRVPDKNEFEDPTASQRLDIAVTHMTAGTGPLRIEHLGPMGRTDDPENEVLLEDFGKWARKIGWNVPPELPGVECDAKHRDPVKEEKPTGARWPAHETKNLTALRLAAVKWWGKYDPQDPGTAPTNKTVSEWLQKEHDISATMADTMATILRADGLKPGPR